MPCYNAAGFISNAIESVLNQTYPNFELIVVDDGSTDNSAEIIKSFTDIRLKYIYQENQGQCIACNNGFKKSTGVLIKFFDADDILTDKVLENQVKVLRGKNDCIAYINWARFYNNNLENKDAGPTQISRDCLPMDYITWQRNTPMLQCGIWLFPRQQLEKNGLWDERLSLINDTEFITRIILNAAELKYAGDCELLYRTNLNSGSLSQTLSKKGLESALLSIDLMSQHLLQKENSLRVKTLIVQSYQMLREWAFPQHLKYVRIVEKRFLPYADIKIHYRSSGYLFNCLLKVFGWKVARLLQYYYYKFRV
jgi:glycosyltransferase involved in cell wall biosynthesis